MSKQAKLGVKLHLGTENCWEIIPIYITIVNLIAYIIQKHNTSEING